MNEPNETEFVAYPRPNSPEQYGTTRQMASLGESYYALNRILFVNVTFLAVTLFIFAFLFDYGASLTLGFIKTIIAVALLFICPTAYAYPHCEKITFGLGWPRYMTLTMSVLIGLNTIVCAGFIGHLVLQHFIYKELSRYGLKVKPGGLRKAEFEEALEKRRNATNEPTLGIDVTSQE